MSKPKSTFNIPEPSLEPPDDGVSVTAGCGHEVYAGESLVYWKNSKGRSVSLCPDCFRDKIEEMSIEELAGQFGCDYTTVE